MIFFQFYHKGKLHSILILEETTGKADMAIFPLSEFLPDKTHGKEKGVFCGFSWFIGDLFSDSVGVSKNFSAENVLFTNNTY